MSEVKTIKRIIGWTIFLGIFFVGVWMVFKDSGWIGILMFIIGIGVSFLLSQLICWLIE